MTSSPDIPHDYSDLATHVNPSDWDAYMDMMHTATRKTNLDSPITLDNTKRVWVINTTNGAVTVNLPSDPLHGYIIKNKVDYGSAGNNITLESSETIEETIVYPGESAILEFDPTEGYFWT